MKINWLLVLLLLWVLVLVCVIVDQYQIAAVIALITTMVGFCVLVTSVWRRHYRPAGWRVWASTDDNMVGSTLEDTFPPEAAALFDTHFSQPNPGVLVMGRNTDGTWDVITHDEKDDPDI